MIDPLALPRDAQIRWMKAVWERELESRQHMFHGKLRIEKLIEAQKCLSICDSLLKQRTR